jgi:hypothetical protein
LGGNQLKKSPFFKHASSSVAPMIYVVELVEKDTRVVAWVTILGEFLPVGRLFTLGCFLKITKVALSSFSPRYKLCSTKKWVGSHFGRFFHKLTVTQVVAKLWLSYGQPELFFSKNRPQLVNFDWYWNFRNKYCNGLTDCTCTEFLKKINYVKVAADD